MRPSVNNQRIRLNDRICAALEHRFVVVWNAGEPIPSDCIDKIFEPFWRHSVPGSRNGLGLGLHICAQIVRAHEGQLSVTSTAENGTRFTARLPLGTLQKVESSAQLAAANRESCPHPSSSSASRSASP